MPGGSVRRSGNSRDRQQHSSRACRRATNSSSSSRAFRSRFTPIARRGGRPTCRTRSICLRAAACSRVPRNRAVLRAARGRLVARVSAVVNRRYIEHWNEQLGQLIHFEALEDEDDAVAAMLGEPRDGSASAGWMRRAAASRRFWIIHTRSTTTDRSLRFCCAEIHRSTIATSRTPASRRKKDRSITPRSSALKCIARYRGMAESASAAASRFEAGASSDSWRRSTRGPT